MQKLYKAGAAAVKSSTLFLKFITAVFFVALTTVSKAQCPPGAPCNFLTKVGGLASLNGAEISAFDPGSKRVFTVAGPVIEFHEMNNAGALSFGGTLPLGFTPPAGQTAIPNSVAVHEGSLPHHMQWPPLFQ